MDYKALAKLGGFTDSKRTGIAGWDTLRKGWDKLLERVQGMLMAKQMLAEGIDLDEILSRDRFNRCLEKTRQLASNVYDYVVQNLNRIGLQYGDLESVAGLANSPSIYVKLAGDSGNNEQFEIKPDTYWQLNSYTSNGGQP